MPHLVGIFDPEWVLQACIDTSDPGLPVTATTGPVEAPVQALATALTTRPAESLQPEKDESGCVTGFISRAFGEPGYAQAVCDEYKRAGFRAYGIDAALLPFLPRIPQAARGQVLPEVLFMEPELAAEVLTQVCTS